MNAPYLKGNPTMDWKRKIVEGLVNKSYDLVSRGSGLVQVAQSSERVRQGAQAARVAAMSLPVKELAVICGRTGAANAVVEGALGAAQAAKAYHKGKIDGKQAIIHAGSEAGCGFVSSATGTAGTLALYMITGTMGPMAIAAGMGASIGSRYVYRRVVGETIPGEDAGARETDIMEEIGPKPQDD